MIPELFHLGPIPISPFGISLVAAFSIAFMQLRWGMRRIGVGTEDDANSILLAAAFGAIVGGKGYYALLYGDWRLLYSRGGIVYYGSFLLAALFVYVLLRRRSLPVAAVADAVGPSLAAGYAVGRVGCLLVGDDYGVPTDKPWGISFPHGPIPSRAGDMERNFGVEIPDGVAHDALLSVHPTQIYETLIALCILVIGRRLIIRHRSAGGTPSLAWRPGAIALLTFGLLAVERFLVEFLRAKDDRFFADTLTMAQIISLAIVAFLCGLALRRRSSGSTADASGR